MGVAYNTSITRSGLVFHMDAANIKSYPGSGTAWNDLSGNGNNGTLLNGPTYNSGNLGGIVFDGVNDYVDCGTKSVLDFGTGSATIAVWFKTSATTGCLVSKRTTSGFQTYVFNSKLYADGAGTAGVSSSTNVNDNTPKYGVFVYDRASSLLRLYINAVANNTVALGATTLTDAANVNIGRKLLTTPGDYFNGNIFQVKIYNRALSETEIKQNFEATRGRYGV